MSLFTVLDKMKTAGLDEVYDISHRDSKNGTLGTGEHEKWLL